MYEIESVLMDNDEAVVEEYLDESEHQNIAEEATYQESPPKKKTPIIRRPGELVTPIRNRHPGSVKVTPSQFAPNASFPGVTLSDRRGTTWHRVTPHEINTSVKVITPSTRQITPKNREDTPGRDNGFQSAHSNRRIKTEPTSVRKVTLESLDAKLNALDEKLNRIVAKLGEHDGALQAVKYHVKDLKNELTNVRAENHQEARTLKRRRQPQIMFPITDDSHLLRVEEQVQIDNQIREELFDRFLDAPGTDIYRYLRKNVGYLFDNTSKYTWTGKPSNSNKDAGPSGVARQLSVVGILIDSGCEKFPHYNRDEVEKQFKRSLDRLNDVKVHKIRALKRLAVSTEQETGRNDEVDIEMEEEEEENCLKNSF